MATTYVGFWTPAPDYPGWASLRETGSAPAEVTEKRNKFPSSLPPTCKIIGSWALFGPGPHVIVVETESVADLMFIQNYYAGWLVFDWRPCINMPRE